VKVVTYSQAGEARLGFVSGETVIDALGALPDSDAPERAHFASALAFIRSGGAGRQAAERLIADAPAAARRPLASVKLVAPLLPSTMLCSGSNYHDHNKEKAAAPISGKEPEFFVKTADCVIGPGDAIVYDEVLTRKLDAETELAIVIGTAGRHIPVKRALDHVFGYTIVNDVTARDLQKTDGQWARAKGFDTFCPVGPAVVEGLDWRTLEVIGRVNGVERQRGSTKEMIFDIPQLLKYISAIMTLEPGDLVATGTPAGVGLLAPGDVVEVEIPGVGILSNPVRSAGQS